MARATITQEMIQEINELYLKIGTYSGVSKAMGGTPSPSTVKKYIIPDYVSKDSIVEKKFDENLIPKTVDFRPFVGLEEWGVLCKYTEEEEEEMEELRKEMVV